MKVPGVFSIPLGICILSCGFQPSLQGQSKASRNPLLEEVVRSPNPGNLTLLAGRACVEIKDLEKRLDALKKAKGRDSRRNVLKKWGMVVDHAKLVKDVETWFLKRLKSLYPGSTPKPLIRDSRYYRVLSTASEEKTKLAENHMDAIHVKYREVFKFSRKPDEKFVLILLRNREEYVEFTQTPQSAAMYIPTRRSLVCASPRDGKSFGSFYHEGLHQFLLYYYPNVPPWLNEGLAEYFEPSRLKIKYAAGRGKRNFDFLIGIPPRDELDMVRGFFRGGNGPGLSYLFDLTLPQFYSTRGNYTIRGYPVHPVLANYASAWSIVHFLIHAGGGKYRQYLLAYLKELREGKYPKEVNQALFKKLDEYKLTEAWKAYILTLNV